MQAPCLGVIDVGSNSIRLLVGRAQGGQVERLFGHRITTRMLQGVRDGLLTEKAIGENAATIAELTRLARAHGAQRVLAFGTSALRDAVNREALSDRTQQLCGVRVTLLSGCWWARTERCSSPDRPAWARYGSWTGHAARMTIPKRWCRRHRLPWSRRWQEAWACPWTGTSARAAPSPPWRP